MTTPEQPDHLSGLPPIESEDRKKMRLRLDASREWLKDYQSRRREEQQPEQAAE